MKVLAYDPYLPLEKVEETGANLCDNLPELLKESDIISIHTPLTKETRGFIGEKELSHTKCTAFLINVGRGGIVEKKALAKALKEKWIAGVATDVSPTNLRIQITRYLRQKTLFCVRGGIERAKKAQANLVPLRLAFSIGSFPIVIKDVFELMGIKVGTTRAPVQSLNKDKQKS